MATLTFVDFQGDHNRNQSRIRSHAAKLRYRRERAATAKFAKEKHLPELSSSFSALPENAPVEASIFLDKRQDHKLVQQHLIRRSPALLPPTILPPEELKQIELILSQTSSWMKGAFDALWRPSVQQDPVIYDFDNGNEIIRESLFIVSDLVALKKTAPAFEILNCLLDIIPEVFRDPHPDLLFLLVELSAGISLNSAPLIYERIKTYVANLASIMLGELHPLTILLKCKFGAGIDRKATELVSACILDNLATTFGPCAYQTIAQQFFLSQFYSNSGKTELARHLMLDVQKQRIKTHGCESALARVAQYELSKINFRRQAKANWSEHIEQTEKMLQVEEAIGIRSNKLDVPIPASGQITELPDSAVVLARHLLFSTKRNSMASNVYSRGAEVDFGGHTLRKLLRNRLLADKITNIVKGVLFPPDAT